MGMFRDCCLRGATFPFGPPKGSKNYVPISLFRTTTVTRQAAEEGLDPGDIIERKSIELAASDTQILPFGQMTLGSLGELSFPRKSIE